MSLTDALDRLKAGGKLDGLAEESKGDNKIELALIRPDPDQPRREFDQAKLQGLADNIKKLGVLQPIVVQPKKDGYHTIIMGERRYRAAKLAGNVVIPCIVRKANSNLRAVQIAENIQREDLTTFEIAQAVEQLRKDGKNRDEIAELLGWSKVAISQFSQLLKMPNELQELAKANVSARPITELHKHWKSDRQAVLDFIEAVDPKDITRASAVALSTSPVPPSEPDQGEAEQSSNPPKPAPKNKQPAVKKTPVSLVCQHKQGRGILLLDRPAGSGKKVLVKFEDGQVLEIPLSEIELVEAISP